MIDKVVEYLFCKLTPNFTDPVVLIIEDNIMYGILAITDSGLYALIAVRNIGQVSGLVSGLLIEGKVHMTHTNASFLGFDLFGLDKE